MSFFICERSKKIIVVGLCHKNAAAGRCSDGMGRIIFCDNNDALRRARQYSIEEVFSQECIAEYQLKCAAELQKAA